MHDNAPRCVVAFGAMRVRCSHSLARSLHDELLILCARIDFTP